MNHEAVFEAGALTGRQQAFATMASHCTYAQAVSLKAVHESRAYEHLGLNWEEYCAQHAGISRVTAESIIRRLDEFGETYFRLAGLVRISPDAFRQIADRLTAECIELGGEQIPLVSGNAGKIRAGIKRLQDEAKRLNNCYRLPTRIVEYGIRVDDVVSAVSQRAQLGRALPHEELAGLRSLARRAINRWTEVHDLLKSATHDSVQ